MRILSLCTSRILRGITLIGCQIAICIAFAHQVMAEGSIDLNKYEGARFYRIYLEYSLVGPFQVTSQDVVPATNKIFVYAEIGESLLLASSALSTSGGLSGSIQYTKPDGTTIVVLSAPGATSGTTGFIADRAQEKAGPYGLLNGGVGGYTPFNVAVDQTGIWTVEFIPQNPNDVNGTGAGPRLTTANWPTQQRRCMAAWDVSIMRSGALVSGRVYAKWLPLNPGGLTASGNWVTSTTEMWVRTRDGILYRWLQDAFAGYGHSRISNNSGIMDLSFQRLFESTRFQPTPPTDRRMHEPDDPDTDAFYTSKMFFNVPDAGMPATAQLGSEANHWLNPIFDNTPPTFFFTGQGAVNPMDGVFTVGYPTVQKATVIVDCSADNVYGNNNDRYLDFYTSSTGTTNVNWDGLDGNGDIMTNGCYMAQVLLQNGEVHFPLLDIENNFGGMVLERLNGPGTVPDYTIHWNDVPLGDNTELPVGSYLKSTPVSGISSLVNPHRWASVANGSYTQTHSSQYGDSRFMDTWSYALSSAMSAVYLACGVLDVKIESLNARNDGVSNVITWRLQLEQNDAIEELQRSVNGRDYVTIATRTVNASSPIQASHIDASAVGNECYYRLRLTSPGLKPYYSRPVRVSRSSNQSASLKIYPNPVDKQTVFSINVESEGLVTVEIVDQTGKKISSQNKLLTKGHNVLQPSALNELPAGIYMLRVVRNGKLLVSSSFVRK
jgi:hypothetical protein